MYNCTRRAKLEAWLEAWNEAWLLNLEYGHGSWDMAGLEEAGTEREQLTINLTSFRNSGVFAPIRYNI